MQLTYSQYRDKVRACWLGKNIGGTLGAPFECIRGVYDLEYYTHSFKMGGRTYRNYSFGWSQKDRIALWVAYPLCKLYTKSDPELWSW